MTDVWELAAYVEAHPANHKERWRLAKKLYTTWEYRLALEHLLILKNEIEPRENVMRYLAATYYRLGRYEESVQALKDALDVWPGDLGLREQLARTQSEAGQNEDALKSWQTLQEKAPDHPFAKQAIARLKKIVEREAREKSGAMQAVKVASPGAENGTGNGAEASPGKEVACPKCGQKNSADFKHCWKCNAELVPGDDFLEGVIKKPERIEPARLPYPVLIGIVIAGFIALAVYCTLRGIAHVKEISPGTAPATSVVDFMDTSLLWTRIMIGAALLIGWPFAWRLAAYLTNTEDRIYNELLYQCGALLALITYALLWLPWHSLLAATAVPVVLSAVVAGFLALKIGVQRAAAVWALQLGMAMLLILAVIVGHHGPGLLTDAPKIIAYARESSTRAPYEGTLRSPGQLQVQWKSSGASWLDRHASAMLLTLRPAPHERSMFVETLENGQRLSFEQMSSDTYQQSRPAIRMDVPYVYTLSGDKGIEVGATIRSLLPFTVELTAAP